MGSVCTEQHHHHKFHPHPHPHPHPHHHKPHEIPPRKLIGHKDAPAACSDVFSSEGALRKYLPGGGHDSSDSDSDPYSSDDFRMFEFKVRRCTRSRNHDWTDCPFAHPGEKARRRDPRKYHYSGAVCAEHRRGTCSRGDNCEFAHGVFECWLHPSRYRTEACKDGKNCQRKVCFFAHKPRQLRVLPVEPDEPPSVQQDRKYQAEPVSSPLGKPHCCMLCHSVNSFSSTRSTLLNMSSLSPPLSPSASLSPPLSPLKNRSLARLYPASLCPDQFLPQSNPISSIRGGSNFSYKELMNEIISNFDLIQMKERIGNRHLAWLDVPNMVTDEQPQFVLSPSTPIPSNRFRASNFPNKSLFFDDKGHVSGPGSTDPDIGWVDKLLM